MSPSVAWPITVAWPGTLHGSPEARRQTAVPSNATEIPLAELTETALVEASLAGRPGAFDLIVERHRRPVYQLCYRFMGNHEDASDLSQEVFLRAFRGLRKFRAQSSLSTWLYRIGVNVCLTRVGARTPLDKASEPLEPQEHVDTRTASPADLLLSEERGARVRAAIGELPRRQRATLILRVYHEMSHQQIADVLGSSVGAVKANVFHALVNLRKLLKDDV